MTLTGPGGVGKTRLAQHSALDAVGAFADGVWWVELAPIDRGDRVAEAIAMALGIPESTAVPAQDQVVRALADKRALLVLDNCEHVIDASAARRRTPGARLPVVDGAGHESRALRHDRRDDLAGAVAHDADR